MESFSIDLLTSLGIPALWTLLHLFCNWKIYLDFESSLYKILTSKANPIKKFNTKTHLHKPCGFTVYLVCLVGNKIFRLLYCRAETEEDLGKVAGSHREVVFKVRKDF